MSLALRRTLLWATALIGIYVGGWAASAPRSFYDSFPGLGLIWISIDGPYNEHLVRDVGALYLGLAAGTAFAAAQRAEAAAVVAGRVVGLAWLVFSVPHLGYHALHLDGLGAVDVVAQLVSLGSTVVLGALLLLGPERGRARTP
ncbi:hypothetical protein F4692_003052 [Nocardioides cavernae]|uniref:Uncharacterized protein n=1 Tax=Nocardioides cavernae TaxID=1921566 RepID=A0A7Y9H4V2_9ACTN|nr:hypothetical protein [Nocardioides cavernae]NYE37907.1 hypothetical protein [Nocardioides cavernae]